MSDAHKFRRFPKAWLLKHLGAPLSTFPSEGHYTVVKNMKSVYIFDIDGTLSDSSHRVPLIDGKDGPKKWDAFSAACHLDPPLPATLLLSQLVPSCDVLFFTGRSDDVREKTIAWLTKHLPLTAAYVDHHLKMRAYGDNTPDHELKAMWYKALPNDTKQRIRCVFEDRTSVVKMWRAMGVPCFQVKDGDY